MALVARWLVASCAACAWLVVDPPLASAVITFSDPGRNTTPPAPDSIAYAPWQLQGQFLGNLGTPIAPNYFITARHIGGNASKPFLFRGTTYSIDPSFANAGKLDLPNSDLSIWKITGTFPAYATLYTDSNETGKHLVTIGRGTQRGDPVVVGNKTKGWLWGTQDYAQAWGENDVTSIQTSSTAGDLLQFNFNSGNRPNEAILSRDDSGGAVFIQSDGLWKLAGINYGADGYYSLSASGTNPFYAALYDQNGLFYGDPGNPAAPFLPASGSGASYASRISSRASIIHSLIPGCPINQQNYSVTSIANMGTVDVAADTTVGNADAPGSLTAYHLRTNTLTIAPNSSVAITPNGSSAALSTVASLTLAPSAKFDLANNDLIVQATNSTRHDTLQHITSLVLAARDSGPTPWTGFGITSSAAANNPCTTLAVIPNIYPDQNPIFTSFGGLPVDANSILVKYTWFGDANLDGIVNADDYFLIDSAFITQPAGWYNGDFNYDGLINADDYFLIDSAFIAQSASLASSPNPLPTYAPEPSVFTALVGAAFLLLTRPCPYLRAIAFDGSSREGYF